MHVLYYGNEILDKNSLEWSVYTGREKTSGRACGPNINSVTDLKKKKAAFLLNATHVLQKIRIMVSDVHVFK